MIGVIMGFKERYYIDLQTVGFDKNRVHLLCKFLPKYLRKPSDKIDKEHNLPVIVSEVPINKATIVWGVNFGQMGIILEQ